MSCGISIMSIITLKKVNALFVQLDKKISSFQKKSGLNCIFGCGECCKNPDIEATIIEFFPLAYHLFLNGSANYYYQKLSTPEVNKVCLFFISENQDNQKGLCGIYPFRGLICRLFGFSYIIDKTGAIQLVTCKKIKLSFSDTMKDFENNPKLYLKKKCPGLIEFANKLSDISPNLSEKKYPINIAIKKAIEKVGLFYQIKDKLITERLL